MHRDCDILITKVKTPYYKNAAASLQPRFYHLDALKLKITPRFYSILTVAKDWIVASVREWGGIGCILG